MAVSSPDADGENAPPNHGQPTHGRARFLLWIGKRRERVPGFDPEIADLENLYAEWRDDGEQTSLAGWSE